MAHKHPARPALPTYSTLPVPNASAVALQVTNYPAGSTVKTPAQVTATTRVTGTYGFRARTNALLPTPSAERTRQVKIERAARRLIERHPGTDWRTALSVSAARYPRPS